MQTVRLDRLESFVGQEVSVSAWVYNIRSSGKVVFLQLRDGYGWIQAVAAEDAVQPEVWHKLNTLTEESSLLVSGTVSKHPKRAEYELQVSDVAPIQISQEYPISKKEHGVDFLMDNRHLWLRSKSQWAIQRVRHTIIKGIYDFMDERGFTKIDAPILTPNACEGTTELFELEYFDEKAYLSQSGQLYIEAAIFSHNRVFDFGPVFRAEKSKTRRHLTEFWMMDAEVAFGKHEDNIALQQEFIEYLVKRVLERNRSELAALERDTAPLEKIIAPFVRMTHAEAVQKLRAMGSDIKDGDDLGADDETMLTSAYDKPIFVEKYPAAVKAFYMKRDPEDESRVLCADLLAPEGYGEIIGGSEREENYEILKQRISEHQLPLQDFAWYLDLRKYGSVPHSGFGLGLERLVSWMCGLKHLRESIPFPRTINRLRP